MTNKKLLSGILCIVFLLSAFTMSASALTFSDVENDPTVAWAKPYINQMAEKGYIKGYEDGTFKPNNTISKTEALILLSRMIGVNDEEFADSVAMAVEEYEPVLDDYSTNYKTEVSYLLYTGVLEESDLDSYISSTNKNAALKRYEAAILLTKLLGASAEVENNAFVSSSYADTLDIPSNARAYVEYVKEAGIMQGMGNNAEGKPEFWPNSAVTRSQMAKMLYTLIDVIDLKLQNGTLEAIDTFENIVTVNVNGGSVDYEIDESTVFRLGGKSTAAEDMTEGITVNVIQHAGRVALIENVVTIEDTVLYGLVASVKDSGTTKSVSIADVNDKTKIETYILADNVKIKVSGAIDLLSKVKANNYVSLTIEDGMVTELSVIDKSSSAVGTLVYIDATGEYTVLTIEDQNGNTKEYEISADGVVVTRNNLDSNLSNLMEGDTVSVKMTYGKITKISASSKNQTVSGKITTITHTTSGTTVAIEVSGKTREYKVNKSVSVLINSTDEGTVYDLRPGTDVNVAIESSEITSIKASGTVVKSQLTGTVVSINVTYGLMIVEEDGVEYNVFCNSNTKIIDSATAKSVLLKNVSKGRTATVTGSNASGVLEATAIVLQ